MRKQGRRCGNLEAAFILAKILLGILVATAYVAILEWESRERLDQYHYDNPAR